MHQYNQCVEALLLEDPGRGCIDVSTTEVLATLSGTLRTGGGGQERSEIVCHFFLVHVLGGVALQ